MNLSLLEYFAAHEQLSDFSDPDNKSPTYKTQLGLALCGDVDLKDHVAVAKWEATWRAKLRFIRARAMVEESMKQSGTWQHWIKTASGQEGQTVRDMARPKTTGLSLSEALAMMKDGKTIKRMKWDVSRSITSCTDRRCQNVHIDLHSILASDWMVVP